MEQDVTYTPEQRAIGEAAMAKMLTEERSASMTALAACAERALGGVSHGHWPCHRMADRWLQKRRRRGEVTFQRVGRGVLWSEVKRS